MRSQLELKRILWQFILPLHPAVHEYLVNCRKALRRFPQRPGRQQPAIAETASTVDNTNLEVSIQFEVLQSIIRDDNIDTVGDQHCRSTDTVRIHHDRTFAAPGQQHRLIAYDSWVAISVNAH